MKRLMALMMMIVLTQTGCTPLGLLNSLNHVTPGDGGVRRVAADVAYGPDPRQRLDVYAGKPDGRGARPVIVFFYGGSWQTGRRQDYVFAARALAARGFVVVVPDYRLVPQVRFPAFVEDGAAAVRWTQEHIAAYRGARHRISVVGHSAGAYIALMLALDRQWLAAAGVAPGAVVAAAGLAGPYDFLPLDPGAAQAAFGAWPEPAATQPIRFVRGDAPPVWLGYGTEDDTVRPKNSINLAKALSAAGGRATLKAYQGLSHEDMVVALAKPFRGKASVLADLAAFLREAQ